VVLDRFASYSRARSLTKDEKSLVIDAASPSIYVVLYENHHHHHDDDEIDAGSDAK
jgi:hypothetical protein